MALFLTNDDFRSLIPPEVAVEVMEDVYREMTLGTGVTRKRTQTHISTSKSDIVLRFKTMDGGISKYGTLGLRILPDVVVWPKVGETHRQVYMPPKPGKYLAFDMIFDIETGDLLAIIQDAYLQKMRIAGAHGAAAKHLARQDARTVGLIGSGWLADGILIGICAVRKIESVKVFSPTKANRESFASRVTGALKIPIRAVETLQEAIRDVDIIVTSTNSIEPVFKGEWLRPGVHLTSILTWEVDKDCFQRSDKTVLSLREGGANEGTNYWTKPIEEQIHLEIFHRGIDWNHYPELGEVLLGRAKGRTSDQEICFFCNNVGFGAQFGALGGKAYQLAKAVGAGKEVPTDDWYEDVR